MVASFTSFARLYNSDSFLVIVGAVGSSSGGGDGDSGAAIAFVA